MYKFSHRDCHYWLSKKVFSAKSQQVVLLGQGLALRYVAGSSYHTKKLAFKPG